MGTETTNNIKNMSDSKFKVIDGVMTEFVTNEHGLPIKKCCASCQHKGYGKTGDRICKNGKGNIKPDYVCKEWGLSDDLAKSKMIADGRIKLPSYFRWLRERVDEIVSSPTIQNEKLRKTMIEALPQKYEQEFGSRYMSDI